MHLRHIVLVSSFASAACFTVTNVNIGQKTSLEKQLMGEFEPLSDEELLAASVRQGPSAQGTVGLAVQEVALHARERQLFNRDDIRSLKDVQCVGEALGALLTIRPCAQDSDAAMLALRSRVVDEENSDRQALLRWAQSLGSPRGDAQDVRAAYHRLLLEGSKTGDAVQSADGAWAVR